MKRISIPTTLAALSVLSACSVTNVTIQYDAGAADADADGSPSSPNPIGSDAGPGAAMDDGAASRPDGTLTPGDGMAASDANLADLIDPVAVGRTWTYDVEAVGTSPCATGSQTGTVLDQAAVGGREAFDIKSFCDTAGTSAYSVAGDHVEVYYGGAWILALDAPVQDGHSWSNGALTFTWHDVGTVTVSAGTFAHCWKAQDNGSASYSTYCRGVGPVRWYYEDALGNGYDATLTSKSF